MSTWRNGHKLILLTVALVVLTAGGRKKLSRMRKREEQLLSQAAIPVSKKELRAAAQTLQAVRELFEGPEWRLLLR